MYLEIMLDFDEGLRFDRGCAGGRKKGDGVFIQICIIVYMYLEIMLDVIG